VTRLSAALLVVGATLIAGCGGRSESLLDDYAAGASPGAGSSSGGAAKGGAGGSDSGGMNVGGRSGATSGGSAGTPGGTGGAAANGGAGGLAGGGNGGSSKSMCTFGAGTRSCTQSAGTSVGRLGGQPCDKEGDFCEGTYVEGDFTSCVLLPYAEQCCNGRWDSAPMRSDGTPPTCDRDPAPDTR
jgi:hypothetical protein